MSRYKKPFTSVPEQVEILQRRGLDIGDPQEAENILRRYGYYRLSGYSHYYRGRPDQSGFRQGTSLRQVEALYNFDESLRAVLLEGIGLVEVALRFHVGHRLGRRGNFAHRSAANLDESAGLWKSKLDEVSESSHAEWVGSYDRQERRSQEAFVQHFRNRYGPRLPVWVATEVMTLGTLCELFNMMPENDRKLVSARFGVLAKNGDGDVATLSKWLNHIRHVRNLCAHHGRVWNRNFDVVMAAPDRTAVPEFNHLDDRALRKLYGTLCGLRFLIARVAPDSSWYAKALQVITDFSRRTGISLQNMGFPTGWHGEKIWAPRYEGDMKLRAVADAIDAVEVANRGEAMALVHEKGNDSDRKKWLKYLAKRKALIEHSLGPQAFYPTFQFENGNVSVIVADTNEVIFSRIELTESDPAMMALRAQQWWTSRSPANGFKASPIQQLTVDRTFVFEAARLWSSNSLLPVAR